MTTKYQFIMNDGDGREVIHTIAGDQTWPELVMHFQDFLKGVGYIFDGELMVIDCDGNDASAQIKK